MPARPAPRIRYAVRWEKLPETAALAAAAALWFGFLIHGG